MESYTVLFDTVVESFEIQPDLAILANIDEHVAGTRQQRLDLVERHRAQIASLQRQHAQLVRQVATLTDPHHTAPEILSQLGAPRPAGDSLFTLFDRTSAELDGRKVELAKNLNDLESQINALHMARARLESTLADLDARSQRLLDEDLVQNPDSKIMKINLYKSLGVLVEPAAADAAADAAATAAPDRVLIYNRENDLTNILDVSDKYSDYFVTNHIWDRL
ncbi:Kinetochore protein Spc24 [[Candida] zeylanoides]